MMTTKAEKLGIVRRAVRSVVQSAPELRQHPDLRRRLAERMVAVSMAAADLIDEEDRQNRAIGDRIDRKNRSRDEKELPVAAAQAASDLHGRTAVGSAPGALAAARDAIAFPEFVTSLVTGVFQSITTSTTQQLEAYLQLLEAVTLSAEDFGVQHITDERSVDWTAARFSEFAVQIPGANEPPKLVLRPDADMPEPDVLARALGATRNEVSSVDEEELNETLLPLVRRKLARDRQAMLSSMVMLGMQRIVIDEGRLHASMDLRVDARSLAEQTAKSQVDTRVNTEASGSFGSGIWGASASMSATVGYVKTDEQYSREDLALSAGLRSSVDLAFRTDQIPLDRFATRAKIRRIDQGQVVPGSGLLKKVERVTSADYVREPGVPRQARDPGSAEAVEEREEKTYGPKEGGGKDEKTEPSPQNTEPATVDAGEPKA